MKITGLYDEKTILSELGNRIQQYRISMNITQAELAQNAGFHLRPLPEQKRDMILNFQILLKF